MIGNGLYFLFKLVDGGVELSDTTLAARYNAVLFLIFFESLSGFIILFVLRLAFAGLIVPGLFFL